MGNIFADWGTNSSKCGGTNSSKFIMASNKNFTSPPDPSVGVPFYAQLPQPS